MKHKRYWLAAVWITCCYGQTPSRYTITTLAGNGISGYAGDGGAVAGSQLASPVGVAVNTSGTVFIADQGNARIRQVIKDGTISTAAGNGTRGFSGDGGQATSATFSSPASVAVDSSGNLYIADSSNHLVRKVTTGGIISTVAGSSVLGPGFGGDRGLAIQAQLNTPVGVAVDGSGNLYIADSGNNRIRKVTTDGNINNFAGTGTAGFSGDGAAATLATLNSPYGVAVDAAGNVYIGDRNNHRVRKVSNGTITTVAGNGVRGYAGDLGRATSANLNFPSGVAVDKAGNLYIVDNSNSRVRRVTSTGIIATIAGNGRFAYTGDGDAATSAALFFPTGIALDAAGNIYIADAQNNAVRMLTPSADLLVPPKISGVVGAGSFGAFTAVAPGSWIEIYGSDLAQTARSWADSDFLNQTAPTLVDGTSVTIGGQAAAISYVSGGQLNVLVPLALGTGTQQLTVSSISGNSDPVAVQIDPTRPGMFAPPELNVSGRQYVGAVFNDGATFVLASGAVPRFNSRPARPGEQITIYGIGFGTVSPNVPYGRIVPQANALTGSLQILFGDAQATLSYAGMAPAAVGLYQFNVVVPSVAANAAVPVTFIFNGVKSAQTLYTAVGN